VSRNHCEAGQAFGKLTSLRGHLELGAVGGLALLLLLGGLSSNAGVGGCLSLGLGSPIGSSWRLPLWGRSTWEDKTRGFNLLGKFSVRDVYFRDLQKEHHRCWKDLSNHAS